LASLSFVHTLRVMALSRLLIMFFALLGGASESRRAKQKT